MKRQPLAAAGGETGLAIVCGGGTLPFALADAVMRRGRKVVLFPLRGWADPKRVVEYPHHWLRLGRPSRLLRIAREHGCREITFIGSVLRPSIWKMSPDWRVLALLPQIIKLYRGGDDHLLTGIGRLTE